MQKAMAWAGAALIRDLCLGQRLHAAIRQVNRQGSGSFPTPPRSPLAAGVSPGRAQAGAACLRARSAGTRPGRGKEGGSAVLGGAGSHPPTSVGTRAPGGVGKQGQRRGAPCVSSAPWWSFGRRGSWLRALPGPSDPGPAPRAGRSRSQRRLLSWEVGMWMPGSRVLTPQGPASLCPCRCSNTPPLAAPHLVPL